MKKNTDLNEPSKGFPKHGLGINIKDIKSLIIALIMALIITISVFTNRNCISLLAFIMMAFLAFLHFALVVVFTFSIVRIINYFVIQGKIYPTIIFRNLLPFFSILLISFFFYGAIYFTKSEFINDFIEVLKNFAVKIVPFIAIFTVLTSLIFYTSYNKKTVNIGLRRKNLQFLLLIVSVNILCMYMFYALYKVDKPKYDMKFSYYKNLNEHINSENYEIELLLSGLDLSEPYFLVNKKELIIYSNYSSDENFTVCYKLNKEGKIISKLNKVDIPVDGGIEYKFKGGYLMDKDSIKVISWAFNDDKKAHNYNELKIKEDWKIEECFEDYRNIKTAGIINTDKVYYNDKIKYSAVDYYNVIKGEDTLKIKKDITYYDNYNSEYPAYYKFKNMNFSLLCNNRKEYYIIRLKR